MWGGTRADWIVTRNNFLRSTAPIILLAAMYVSRNRLARSIR